MRYEPSREDRILTVEDAEQLARLVSKKVIPVLEKDGHKVEEVRLFGSFPKGKVCKRSFDKFYREWKNEFEMRTGTATWNIPREYMRQMDDAIVACGGSLSERGLDPVTISCLERHLPKRLYDIAKRHVYSDIDVYFVLATDIRVSSQAVNRLHEISDDMWKYSYPHLISIHANQRKDISPEVLRNSRKIEDIEGLIDTTDIIRKSVERRVEL